MSFVVIERLLPLIAQLLPLIALLALRTVPAARPARLLSVGHVGRILLPPCHIIISPHYTIYASCTIYHHPNIAVRVLSFRRCSADKVNRVLLGMTNTARFAALRVWLMMFICGYSYSLLTTLVHIIIIHQVISFYQLPGGALRLGESIDQSSAVIMIT